MTMQFENKHSNPMTGAGSGHEVRLRVTSEVSLEF